MARKRYTVEQIIAKLREAEIELAQRSQEPGGVPEAGHQREHVLPVA